MHYESLFRVAWLLARRQIQRANRWTTLLIVGIMTLTFLNLVVVNGILVGLIQGSIDANKREYTGDIIIKTKTGDSSIERTYAVTKTLDTISDIDAYTVRTISGGTVEANYRTRREGEVRNQMATTFAGISPSDEDRVTGLASKVLLGEYLSDTDDGYVLVGTNILKEYSGITEFELLRNVVPGSKLKVTVGDVEKEVTVKGLIKSKVGDVSMRVMFTRQELDRLLGRTDGDANEIAIVLDGGVTQADSVKAKLVGEGIDAYADVRTANEAINQFLEDIAVTFGILGNVFGVVGLIVALITIFIVIFINAITRRKSIGVLKGIGIDGRAIELSYILQSIFYASVGSAIGLALLYVVLQPSLAANPIDFPFSDGILVAPVGETMIRLLVLLTTTIIAGYVPARMVIKKNTLDSILGR